MHLRALEDEGKHLRLGQVPTTKCEHHSRKRAIFRNIVSSGDFITANKTFWPKQTHTPIRGEGQYRTRLGEHQRRTNLRNCQHPMERTKLSCNCG